MDVDEQPNRRKRKIDLIDEANIDIVVDEMMKNRRLFKKKKEHTESDIISYAAYDDRPLLSNGQRTHNIFRMSPDDRKYFLATHPNPYNYPQQYIDIYREECTYRKPMGYDHCYDITNVKLFKTNDKINTKIRNITNVNCIKSVEPVEPDLKYVFSEPILRNTINQSSRPDFPVTFYMENVERFFEFLEIDKDFYDERKLNGFDFNLQRFA